MMNRHGEIIIQDDSGRERERYGLVYGAHITVKEGQRVKPNTILAEWDPFSVPIVTEVGGTIQFSDVIEGVTMSEALDEVTGLSRKVVDRGPGRRCSPGDRHRQRGRRGDAAARRQRGGALLPAGGLQHLRQRGR